MKKLINFLLIMVLISVVAIGVFYATSSSLNASVAGSQLSSLPTPNVGWNGKTISFIWNAINSELAAGWNTKIYPPVASIWNAINSELAAGWNTKIYPPVASILDAINSELAAGWNSQIRPPVAFLDPGTIIKPCVG